MMRPHQISLVTLSMIMLSACATNAPQTNAHLKEKMQQELQSAAVKKPAPMPDNVSDALLPPLKLALPKANIKKLEPRFDLVINNAPAAQVLMGIVSGTRYSMLVHPDVSGNISVNLKDVTVFEALDSLRELYGYEYKVDGTRIFIESQALQTRVFQVNYIVGQRRGSSDTQVTSGSIGSGNNSSNSQGGNGNTNSSSNNGNGTANQTSLITSSISTNTSNDFWSDLAASLNGIVGNDNGKKVVVNLQSGVIMVRALPKDIRNVESFLRLMQVNIERQVILEAKILSVQLNNDSQQGVNWSVFGNNGRTNGIIGNINARTQLNKEGSGNLISSDLSASTSTGSLVNSATGTLASAAAATSLGGPLFALALQGANFGALLSFLETQGDVEVLSSPRIATINNQKAVLKVGTDEFYITGVKQNTTATAGATTTTPEVTLQPFFSGIALDVTPQIDKDDNIILHMHPSISQVATVNKQFTLGNSNQFNLPLPSSSVSETDSIVRTRDGSVIAIGGLMTESSISTRSKVPGLGDIKGVGKAFKQNAASSTKTELVILLKATVVQGGDSWSDDMLASQRRIKEMQHTEDGLGGS